MRGCKSFVTYICDGLKSLCINLFAGRFKKDIDDNRDLMKVLIFISESNTCGKLSNISRNVKLGYCWVNM